MISTWQLVLTTLGGATVGGLIATAKDWSIGLRESKQKQRAERKQLYVDFLQSCNQRHSAVLNLVQASDPAVQALADSLGGPQWIVEQVAASGTTRFHLFNLLQQMHLLAPRPVTSIASEIFDALESISTALIHEMQSRHMFEPAGESVGIDHTVYAASDSQDLVYGEKLRQFLAVAQRDLRIRLRGEERERANKIIESAKAGASGAPKRAEDTPQAS